MDPVKWREQAGDAAESYAEMWRNQALDYAMRDDVDRARAELDALLDAARDEIVSLQAALGQSFFSRLATCPVCGLEHERGDFGDYCSAEHRAQHLPTL